VDALARLGLLSTCVIALYVGVRTLLIWRRTRMVQELCIGLNIASIAVSGLVLTILTSVSNATGEGYPLIPYTFGLLAMVIHVAAVYAGCWSIFRPGEQWPILVVAAATALGTLWMVLALAGAQGPSEFRSILMLSIRGGGMAWAAFECFSYSAKLRRRAALGLSNPMVAHQIWLWGLSASAALTSISLELGGLAFLDAPIHAWPSGMHVISVLGLTGVLAVAFAFFPPAGYTRWIQARINRSQAEQDLQQPS
jgi:hypothetical protein